jgi:hypothetical protein
MMLSDREAVKQLQNLFYGKLQPNPPNSLTGISMIFSETCFLPIRGSGYETNLSSAHVEVTEWLPVKQPHLQVWIL